MSSNQLDIFSFSNVSKKAKVIRHPLQLEKITSIDSKDATIDRTIKDSNHMKVYSNEFQIDETQNYRFLCLAEIDLLKQVRKLKQSLIKPIRRTIVHLKDKQEKAATSMNLPDQGSLSVSNRTNKVRQNQTSTTLNYLNNNHNSSFNKNNKDQDLNSTTESQNNYLPTYQHLWKSILQEVLRLGLKNKFLSNYSTFLDIKIQEMNFNAHRKEKLLKIYEEYSDLTDLHLKEDQKTRAIEFETSLIASKAQLKIKQMRTDIDCLKTELIRYSQAVTNIKENKVSNKKTSPTIKLFINSVDEKKICNKDIKQSGELNKQELSLNQSKMNLSNLAKCSNPSRLRKESDCLYIEDNTPFDEYQENEYYTFHWYLDSIEDFFKRKQHDRLLKRAKDYSERSTRTNENTPQAKRNLNNRSVKFSTDNVDLISNRINSERNRRNLSTIQEYQSKFMSPKNMNMFDKNAQRNSISQNSQQRGEISNRTIPAKINVANLSKTIKEIIQKLQQKIKYEEGLVLNATEEDENLHSLNEESIGKIRIIQKILKLMKQVQYEKISRIKDLETFTLTDQELANIINIEIPQIIQIMSYKNQIKEQMLQQKRLQNQKASEVFQFGHGYQLVSHQAKNPNPPISITPQQRYGSSNMGTIEDSQQHKSALKLLESPNENSSNSRSRQPSSSSTKENNAYLAYSSHLPTGIQYRQQSQQINRSPKNNSDLAFSNNGQSLSKESYIQPFVQRQQTGENEVVGDFNNFHPKIRTGSQGYQKQFDIKNYRIQYFDQMKQRLQPKIMRPKKTILDTNKDHHQGQHHTFRQNQFTTNIIIENQQNITIINQNNNEQTLSDDTQQTTQRAQYNLNQPTNNYFPYRIRSTANSPKHLNQSIYFRNIGQQQPKIYKPLFDQKPLGQRFKNIHDSYQYEMM